VQGQPKDDAFECDAPISVESGELGSRSVDHEGGLESRTEFRVIRRNDDGTTLLEARPLTGRTNQIRVHCAHLGFPICGDGAYLGGDQLGTMQTLAVGSPPLCLHAWRVAFVHPLTRLSVEFIAPAPEWAGCVSNCHEHGKQD
jgi:23S rRNA-/tRNA-specific pseudouridylate synthase